MEYIRMDPLYMLQSNERRARARVFTQQDSRLYNKYSARLMKIPLLLILINPSTNARMLTFEH